MDTDPAVLQAHMWVIRQCPSLARLEWEAYNHEFENGPMYMLAKEIQSGYRWDRLKVLRLPRSEFHPEDFIAVVKALPQGLVELDLHYTNFDVEWWTGLQSTSRHLQTLTVLDLHECLELGSPAVQSMMCEIPQLRCFRAHMISDTAIINDSRPWICQGLEELTLGFKLENPSSQPMILERLSELKELRKCILYNGRTDVKGTLQPQGLDRLKDLRHMTTFRRPDHAIVDWGEPEAQWVLRHWPKIKELFEVRLSQEALNMLPGVLHFSYASK